MDCRRLNAVSHIHAYTVLSIDDLIDGHGKAKFISTLDLTRGYWYVSVEEKDRRLRQHSLHLIASSSSGCFHLGYVEQLRHFRGWCQDRLVKGCEGFASACLDDLVMYSNSWQDHLSQLRIVLNLIKETGLTVMVGKCQFGTSKRCVYLGHMVGKEAWSQS